LNKPVRGELKIDEIIRLRKEQLKNELREVLRDEA